MLAAKFGDHLRRVLPRFEDRGTKNGVFILRSAVVRFTNLGGLGGVRRVGGPRVDRDQVRLRDFPRHPPVFALFAAGDLFLVHGLELETPGFRRQKHALFGFFLSILLSYVLVHVVLLPNHADFVVPLVFVIEVFAALIPFVFEVLAQGVVQIIVCCRVNVFLIIVHRKIQLFELALVELAAVQNRLHLRVRRTLGIPRKVRNFGQTFIISAIPQFLPSLFRSVNILPVIGIHLVRYFLG